MRIWKKLLVLLMLINLSGCALYEAYHAPPPSVGVISPMGARPTENLLAISRKEISELHLYVSINPSSQYVKKDYAKTYFLVPGVSLISALVDVIVFGIVDGIAQERDEFDKKIEAKVNKESIKSKYEFYFQKIVQDSLKDSIFTNLSVQMDDSFYIAPLVIPLISSYQQNFIIIPEIEKYGNESRDDLLLGFLTLQTYFTNTKDIGFTDTPIILNGLGSLAICKIQKYDGYLKKLPQIKERIKEISLEEEKNLMMKDKHISHGKRKRIEKLEQALQEIQALDGFYIKTFRLGSTAYNESEWLDNNRVNREIEAMIDYSVNVVTYNAFDNMGK